MVMADVSVQLDPVAAVSQADDCEIAACPIVRAAWPCDAEVRYFRSELQLGFAFINAAAEHPPVGEAYLTRALNLYVLLSGWVQSNGGNPQMEQQLQWFRWRLRNVRLGSDEI
jgi:hypothetical protein